MKEESAWKDRGDGRVRQYDFSAPAHWTKEHVRAEQAAIIASLEGAGTVPGSEVPEWLQLARCLPDALRSALIAELRAGNRIAGIGSSRWPNEGSIVVTMQEHFSAARRTPPGGVTWRKVDVPHYWREELHQKLGQIDFLIIT